MGPVQPPHLAAGAVAGECVQHRQHGSGPDAGRQQDHRIVPGGQAEGTAGRRDVEVVAGAYVAAQAVAGHAVDFDFHADPVRSGARLAGQRVTADQRRRVPLGRDLDRDELPRQCGRQIRTVGGGQRQGEHTTALGLDAGDDQRAEARPGGARGGGRGIQPGAAGRSGGLAVLLIQQCLHGRPPAGAECGDPQGTFDLPAGVPGQVEHPVDLLDGHRLGSGGDLDDLLPGFDLAFLEHAQIEAGPVVCHQQCRHPRLAHPQADSVAGHPRLGDLEERVADAVAVTDTDLVVRQAVDGEILPELTWLEIVAAEFASPETVGIGLVHEYCPLLASVTAQIALAVAVDVQPPHHPRPGHRPLVDAGVHGLAVPGDILRHPHAQGSQCGHPATSLAGDPLRELRRRPPAGLARAPTGPRLSPAPAAEPMSFEETSRPCGPTPR